MRATSFGTILERGPFSASPMTSSGTANSASVPISIQKSFMYTPNMAARMAFTACVMGRNGLMFWKNSGSN